MTDLGTRGRSQILRTFLPTQTADLRGHIYRVDSWDRAIPLHVDQEILRRRLVRDLAGFEGTATDNGMAADLRRGSQIEVVEVDIERGVSVERYPRVWLCSRCRRIGKSLDKACRCGATSWDQLHFLGFHTCGATVEPRIRRCAVHDDTALRSPRSSKAADIRFACPECNTETQKGLGFRPCTCGHGNIIWNVHRARTVYTPHGTVLVNPPRPDQMRALLDRGGPRQALDWVLDGMTTARADHHNGAQTAEQLTSQLLAANLPEATVTQMVDIARRSGQVADEQHSLAATLPRDVLDEAEDEAVDIAMATWNERTRVADLLGAAGEPGLRDHYAAHYPPALDRAGLDGLDLVEQFPVLNVMYGFSRGGQTGVSRLVPFRNPTSGAYRLHSELAQTEALFFQLDPDRTATWLASRGYELRHADLPARVRILAAARTRKKDPTAPPRTVAEDVLTLVHSYAHRLIRLLAVRAGIDRDALSEYLVPNHLGFFVYAASRGDFVLGGLQALFETDLDNLLETFVTAEHRCPLDPGCSRGSGACSGCLHLGETSCRNRNHELDRATLFGQHGYLSAQLASSSTQSVV